MLFSTEDYITLRIMCCRGTNCHKCPICYIVNHSIACGGDRIFDGSIPLSKYLDFALNNYRKKTTQFYPRER